MNSETLLAKLSEISERQGKILANQDNDRKLLEEHSSLLKEHHKVLTRNTVTVEEHHKRSLLLEAEIKRVDADVRNIQDHVDKVQHMGLGVVNFFKGLGAMMAGLSTLGGVLWAIYELAKKIGL
jgi:hypothetical protein